LLTFSGMTHNLQRKLEKPITEGAAIPQNTSESQGSTERVF